MAGALTRMLGRPAAAGGGSGHRYWRLNITAAQSDATGVVSIQNLILAESAGGPDVSGSVSSFSANSSQVGYGPSRAFDGDYTTNWASAAGSFPRTITVDFGSTSSNWKDINEIRMANDPAWAPQSPKTFTVDYSDDNSSWTTAITVSSETGWGTDFISKIYQTAACPITLAGYIFIRLNCTTGNQASQFAVGEIEFRTSIGGADVSPTNANQVFYSSQSSGNEASRAFDNSNSTGYFSLSGQAYPQNLGVEMSQRRAIVEASIIPYSGFPTYAPKDGTIQGSNDRTTWTTLISFSNQTGWSANPTARVFS